MNNKYKRWNQHDRDVIKNNYRDKNNYELARMLDRTEDSVRKEMNKLKLKRPTKASYPSDKVPKKMGRKKKIPSVMDCIQNAAKEKQKREREAKRALKRKKNRQSEMTWATNFINDTDDMKKPVTRKMDDTKWPSVVIPGIRAEFKINPGMGEKHVNERISAYQEKFNDYKIIVKNSPGGS